jgi:hypothetical protein
MYGESFASPTINHCIGIVPLDGLVEYYADLDVVSSRLETASRQLVQRWNALIVKKSLEWQDEICRQDWIGRAGKAETTIFEVRLSTYGFFTAHRENPSAVITTADVKVSTASRLAISNAL